MEFLYHSIFWIFTISVEPYPNDKSIEKKINEGKAKDTMLAGFSFDTSDFGNGTSPIKLNVSLSSKFLQFLIDKVFCLLTYVRYFISGKN